MRSLLLLAFFSTYALAGPGIDVVGTDARDQITTSPDNDTVDARKGDDVIIMGEGQDVAFWQPADGDDFIDCGPGLLDTLVIGDNTFQKNRLGEPLFDVDNSIASCEIERTGRPRTFIAQVLAKPDLTPGGRITLVNCEFVICADPLQTGKQVFNLRRPIPRLDDQIPFYARNNLVNRDL